MLAPLSRLSLVHRDLVHLPGCCRARPPSQESPKTAAWRRPALLGSQDLGRELRRRSLQPLLETHPLSCRQALWPQQRWPACPAGLLRRNESSKQCSQFGGLQVTRQPAKARQHARLLLLLLLLHHETAASQKTAGQQAAARRAQAEAQSSVSCASHEVVLQQ